MTDDAEQRPDRQLGAAPAKGAPRRRSRAFGRALLSKLPKLPLSRWEAKDTLNIYKDLQGVVELDADAFLEPLEPLARKP
jgi:hypothetical protein